MMLYSQEDFSSFPKQMFVEKLIHMNFFPGFFNCSDLFPLRSGFLLSFILDFPELEKTCNPPLFATSKAYVPTFTEMEKCGYHLGGVPENVQHHVPTTSTTVDGRNTAPPEMYESP